MAVVDLVFKGFVSGSQTWSTHIGLVQFGSGAVGQVDLDTWLASVKPAVVTWWGAANGVAANNDVVTTLDHLQAYYRLGPGGTPVLTSTQAINLAGTSASSQTHGFRQCAVQGLLTGVPGRRNRGRMFLPINKPISMTATHGFSATVTAGLAASTAAMIHSINAIALGTNGLFAGPENGSGGPATQYSSVQCDNKPDTQRRRSNKLPASASSTSTI